MADVLVVRRRDALQAALAEWRGAGHSIALVPTMGALHAGHVSLMTIAGRAADRVVASLFVNPRQFSAGEDLARYPRDEAGDLATMARAGVGLCYAPPADDIYPPGFATTVRVARLGDDLCGLARPGHFEGVATVVTKLLLRVLPDYAVFGEKDWQQLVIIRRLVADLDIPVRILSGPTVREGDGLALSSRNAYLTPGQRRIAPMLHQTLQETRSRLAAGQPAAVACQAAGQALVAAGFSDVDYVTVRDAATLGPAADPGAAARRILAAARLGATRLIDNIGAD
ncbi:MAG: pantoate--beta-alanine ligase [Alphaproteobacteria bacterium]